MHTSKTRNGSSQVPQKVSPRAVRKLSTTTTLEIDSVTFSSSNQDNSKTSKEISPKLTNRKSPRSPVPERKRPSRISELESRISKLQDDLKNVKDQLILSESCKKQAQEEAEESKEQLLTLSVELEESQRQYLALYATGEARAIELKKISEERDSALKSKLNASEKRPSINSTDLASALTEVQMLRVELELVANCVSVQTQNAESTDKELLNLKQNLSESGFLMNMKKKLENCKETLLQLEAAKRTVEILRDDVARDFDGYNNIAFKLENSRARVDTLATLVRKLETQVNDNESIHSDQYLVGECKFEKEHEILKNGEQIENVYELMEQIKNAYELMEQIKSESGDKQCELESELERKKCEIDELKANLMDKETELQGITEENENLNSKLENNMSSQNDNGLRKEVKRLEQCVEELKSNMMDKETTLQTIIEENETAKAAEHEAATKFEIAMEEADRSNRKAARVVEQLEGAQAASLEMEGELRRVKVQCEQWRKAAEAAAAMISIGNNEKVTERSVSLDDNYKCSLAYGENIDDEFQRKKNGNMLKKIGVLWKKPQK